MTKTELLKNLKKGKEIVIYHPVLDGISTASFDKSIGDIWIEASFGDKYSLSGFTTFSDFKKNWVPIGLL